MRLAYADPPYLGSCRRYAHHHPDGRCWDDLETHRRLIARLGEYEGWALSMTSNSLRDLLPLCPSGARVGAWVKPFAAWKRGVSPAYAWEPVVYAPARRLPDAVKVADYVSVPITLRRGLVGAKPDTFAWWVFAMLGAAPEDTLDDLYPGTGGVGRAWDRWRDHLWAPA